jgi:TRAP-type mannitol/chloroaromatic compound transport system substrate-binding protein
MAKKNQEASVSRRKFLKGAGVTGAAAAAAIAMPQVSRAQTVTWRFQSTWPTRDIFHEMAVDYANKVNTLTGGRVRLDVLAAGAVVGAFQMQDAVHAGVLDGGHGVTAYWYGKHKGFSLFGTGPSYGWDAQSQLAWFYHGGGEAFYNELINQILRVNVVGFLYFPMPTQPLGWFKQPITSAAQLRNLKYRTVGLSADLYTTLGAAVTILAGGEIVPALDRAVIDAAEFNNPSSDLVLGFTDVAKNYMLQSHHQQMECFEVIFNKTKFDALPAEVKTIMKHVAHAASADQYYLAHKRYSEDLAEIKRRGVAVLKTPDAVLQAQLQAWDTVIAELSKDPFNKKVLDSQRAWVERTSLYFFEAALDPRGAYKHFFNRDPFQRA